MQHPTQHGSNVSSFYFAPRFGPDVVQKEDDDGNIWPNYCFERAVIELMPSDSGPVQMKRITALPCNHFSQHLAASKNT